MTGDKALTVHGFRSSFADFAAWKDFPDSVIEASLAHIDLNKTRASYRRDERMDKRRELAEVWGRWADFRTREDRGEGPADSKYDGCLTTLSDRRFPGWRVNIIPALDP